MGIARDYVEGLRFAGDPRFMNMEEKFMRLLKKEGELSIGVAFNRLARKSRGIQKTEELADVIDRLIEEGVLVTEERPAGRGRMTVFFKISGDAK